MKFVFENSIVIKNLLLNYSTQVLTPAIVFEFNVDILPAPARRVDASGDDSNGRPHASADHGALSYILKVKLINPLSIF